jgi:hypothetical protein
MSNFFKIFIVHFNVYLKRNTTSGVIQPTLGHINLSAHVIINLANFAVFGKNYIRYLF